MGVIGIGALPKTDVNGRPLRQLDIGPVVVEVDHGLPVGSPYSYRPGIGIPSDVPCQRSGACYVPQAASLLSFTHGDP